MIADHFLKFYLTFCSSFNLSNSSASNAGFFITSAMLYNRRKVFTGCGDTGMLVSTTINKRLSLQFINESLIAWRPMPLNHAHRPPAVRLSVIPLF
jgi:hypothetical protein